MDAARERALRETAIGAAHDVLAADQLGEPHYALCDELGMLDDVGGMADHAGDQNLAGRKLHAFPYPPFVGVARIGSLERVVTSAHLQQQADDVLERHVESVRAVPATPTDVIARAFFGNIAQSVVERVNTHLRPA